MAARRPDANPPASPDAQTIPDDQPRRMDHTDVPAPDFDPLEHQIRQRMQGQAKRYAVYIEDISSGHALGINHRDEFVAASTIKLPIVLYLFILADQGTVNLDQRLTYRRQDYETGSGGIQYEDLGTRYSLRELAKQALVASDNVAINMLIRRLGEKQIHQFMRGLGGEVMPGDSNVTSARDMGIYLRNVLTLSRSNSRLGSELVEYLSDTAYADRIRAGVPKEVRVAHKIGNQIHNRHDVGIVFLPSRTFVIAMMVEDPDEPGSDQAIADVAGLAYRFFEQLPKVSTPTPP